MFPTNIKLFFLGLIISIAAISGLFFPNHVNAASGRDFSVVKTMKNLSMPDNEVTTVSQASDDVEVVIAVTNLTFSTIRPTITDWFRDPVTTEGFAEAYGAGWYYLDADGYHFYTNTETGIYIYDQKVGGGTAIGFTAIPYSNTRYLIYRLHATSALYTNIDTFPTTKPRMLAFPVVNASGMNEVKDVSYVTFLPKYSTSGMSVESSSLYDGGPTSVDKGFIFPGASVRLPNNNNQVVTSPSAWLYALYGPRVTADRTVQRTCGGAGGIPNPSRSGACVYSSVATIGVNPQGAGARFNVSSNPATVQTLPGSAIIGNVRVGGNTNSDVSKILLPGQHLSSGVSGVTSTQNLSYSVDDNTVSALKIDPAADIYGNVFLDANLALAQKNPDYLLGPGNASPMSNNFNTAPNNGFNMTCTPTCSTTATGFSLTPKTTDETRLDLSSINMTNGASAGTTPTKTNNNGYVWFVDGNLTLTGNGTSFSTIKNLVKGTIVVKGQLVIQNVRIDQYNGATLGFIVMGSGGIIWRTQTSTLPTPPDFALNSVAFFANTSLVGSTNNNNQVLSLKGSIVARNSVNFLGVKPFVSSAGAAASVDAFSLRIQYDANLVDNPPPRMSLIGGLPGFTQGGL